MDKPLISVIIPVYKSEKYLERCVKSVQAQTCGDLEIILVDDGSPDRSGELCETLAAADTRIKVMHRQNGGAAAARNTGLDAMSGQYAGFVDADDEIDPRMYETLLALLREENAQISCCGVMMYSSAGSGPFNPTVGERLVYERGAALGELLNNIRITNSFCDKLYCASVFANIRFTEGVLYEDLEAMPRCIAQAARVAYISQPLYNYYFNDGSAIHGKYNEKRFDAMSCSRSRIDFYAAAAPEHLDAAKAAYIKIGVEELIKSDGEKSCRAARKARYRELAAFLRGNRGLPLPEKLARECALLRMGLPVFSAAHRVRARIGAPKGSA